MFPVNKSLLQQYKWVWISFLFQAGNNFNLRQQQRNGKLRLFFLCPFSFPWFASSCKVNTIFIIVYKLFEILTVVSIAVTKFVLIEGRYADCMEWVVICRKQKMLFLIGEGISLNLEVFLKSATAKIFTLAHHLVKQGDEQDLSSSSVVDCSVAHETSVT